MARIFNSRQVYLTARVLPVLLVGALGLLSCSSGNIVPAEMAKYADQWPAANRDYSNTRATQDSGISSQNVQTLGIAWTFALTGFSEWGAAATNPLILNNIVYFQDLKSNVFAIDLATGKLLWKKDYNLDSFGPNGPAVGWDKLFVTKGHYEVAALNLMDGKELWATRLSAKSNVGIDIQLIAYNNMVFVSTVPGSTNADFYTGGGYGVIYALDQKTGKEVWKFSTVDSVNVWGNPSVNSGGGAWYQPAIDTDTGITYWGTGNPGPIPGTDEFPSGSSRPGPNLYSESMLALDSATGKLLWYKQVKPHDLFDLDFQSSPILTTATINGKQTNIVIGSGKIGKVYAFNRKNGEIYWQTPVGLHQNDELTELPAGMTKVLPGPDGGVLTPMACADGVLYVPVVIHAGDYTPTEFVESTYDESAGTGELVALDVPTGKPLWSKSFNSIAIGAATVVNDLVFTSTLDGMIYALDKRTGNEVWSYQAPGGINGWPAVSGDFIIFPIGLGDKAQLIFFQIGVNRNPITSYPFSSQW
jgi:glucose dehydrogenase